MKSFLVSLIISIIAALTPVIPIMCTVGFLIAADFIVGIYRAFKMKENISSRKMGNTVSKMLLYQITILSIFFFETYILDGVLPVTKIAAGLIATIEIKSIDESIETMTGVGVWKKIVKILRRGNSTTKDFIQ